MTYNYLAFNNAPDNTTTYTVKIDPGTLDEQIISGKHMLAGKNGMGTVSLPVLVGDHDIEAWAEWDTNGHKKGFHKIGQDTVSCLPPEHKDCTILGTAGIDFLDGDINPLLEDVICGFGGDDTLNGKTENDILRGHEGNDNLDGGAGNDKLIGGPGIDNLFDLLGNDKHKGGLGDDKVFDSDGDNRVYGGPGNDSITTGDGNDMIRGGPGGEVGNEESIFAGGGDNTVRGGKGADFIDAGSDDDTVYSMHDDGEIDTIICGDGTDTVYYRIEDDVDPDCENQILIS